MRRKQLDWRGGWMWRADRVHPSHRKQRRGGCWVEIEGLCENCHGWWSTNIQLPTNPPGRTCSYRLCDNNKALCNCRKHSLLCVLLRAACLEVQMSSAVDVSASQASYSLRCVYMMELFQSFLWHATFICSIWIKMDFKDNTETFNMLSIIERL